MAINVAGQTNVGTTPSDMASFIEQQITFDATAIVATDYTRISVGFKPRRIVVTNLTDRVSLEWSASMGTDNYLKTIATGVRTLDTTAGALVISDRYFDILQNATLGLILASKVVLVQAWA